MGACEACEGKGVVTVYDFVPYGIGFTSMPTTDICPDCVGNGRCPVCGAELADDPDDLKCEACGWKIETN